MIKESTLIKLIEMRRAGLSEGQMQEATGIRRQAISKALQAAGIAPLQAWQRAHAPATLAPTQEQMVIGTMLGDGHIQGANPNRQAYVAEQAQKQRDYLLHKYEVLKPFCHKPPTERANRDYPSIRFATMSHPVFAAIRRQMTGVTGNRILPPALMEKITPAALAYWYMDDGSVTGSRTKGNLAAVIYSYKLGPEQNRMIADWLLQRWGIRASLTFNKKKSPGRQWSLSLGSSQRGRSFLNLIEPYVVPSMSYKLDI